MEGEITSQMSRYITKSPVNSENKTPNPPCKQGLEIKITAFIVIVFLFLTTQEAYITIKFNYYLPTFVISIFFCSSSPNPCFIFSQFLVPSSFPSLPYVFHRISRSARSCAGSLMNNTDTSYFLPSHVNKILSD